MRYLLGFLLLSNRDSFSQNTILWRISDSTTHHVSYLVGTFHQFGSSFVDSFPQIATQLRRSELAIFESVDNEKTAIQLINQRPDNPKTVRLLNKRKFRSLRALTQRWRVSPYKLTPTEINLKLQQSLNQVICQTAKPSDAFDHFDNYLIHQARQGGVEVMGLESDSLQMAYLSQFAATEFDSESIQLMLKWTEILVKKDRNAYDCGYADSYRKLEIDYQLGDPCDESDEMIGPRNAKWLPLLVDKLKSHSCFVAVGLLHLCYQCGLIVQMRKAGFVVEEVALK
jgi:uncharacterized protein